LPATRRFHTDSHRVQCCLEFSWDGTVSVYVNEFFHFALKRYFISKTVGASGAPSLTSWSTICWDHRCYDSICSFTRI